MNVVGAPPAATFRRSRKKREMRTAVTLFGDGVSCLPQAVGQAGTYEQIKESMYSCRP